MKIDNTAPSHQTRYRHIAVATGVYLLISALIYVAFQVFGAEFITRQLSVSQQTASEWFWNLQIASAVMAVEVGIIVGLTKYFYRGRSTQMQQPAQPDAKRELLGLVGYLIAVQVLGLALGKLLGWHAISFHLAGSMYGTSDAVGWGEIIGWMSYNSLAYVVLPVLYFTKVKGYTLAKLNIISTKNVRRDILLIVVVLAIEVMIQLGGVSNAILHLPFQQGITAGLVAFAVNFFGTALPTAIFIYALMFSRMLAVFRSPITVICLGGLTYAAVHFFDYWMVFTSMGAFLASLGGLFLQYFMPGVIKSVLTYRTGNPWVHLWAYHAIAPHVVLDTTHFVELTGGDAPSPHH